MHPSFGSDYDVGWIGFTRAAGLVTAGIAYGERSERIPQFPEVTHAFIVSGNDAGIEAHLETGVARFALAKYSNDPNCKLYFRRPSRWTPALGERIAAAAAGKLGAKYDTSLIAAEALTDTFLGRLVNHVTAGRFKRLLCRGLDRPGAFICSELAAFALASQREYNSLGCLLQPLDTIDPQTLFQDSVIFDPGWVSVR